MKRGFRRRACGTCFFFNDTATTEIYTLSLHDALPISVGRLATSAPVFVSIAIICGGVRVPKNNRCVDSSRSEEHTSELQSLRHLVCRLLLEKKQSALRKSHVERRAHSGPGD